MVQGNRTPVQRTDAGDCQGPHAGRNKPPQATASPAGDGVRDSRRGHCMESCQRPWTAATGIDPGACWGQRWPHTFPGHCLFRNTHK